MAPFAELFGGAITKFHWELLPGVVFTLRRSGWSFPTSVRFTEFQTIVLFAALATIFSHYKRRPFWLFMGFLLGILLMHWLPALDDFLRRL